MVLALKGRGGIRRRKWGGEWGDLGAEWGEERAVCRRISLVSLSHLRGAVQPSAPGFPQPLVAQASTSVIARRMSVSRWYAGRDAVARIRDIGKCWRNWWEFLDDVPQPVEPPAAWYSTAGVAQPSKLRRPGEASSCLASRKVQSWASPHG